MRLGNHIDATEPRESGQTGVSYPTAVDLIKVFYAFLSAISCFYTKLLNPYHTIFCNQRFKRVQATAYQAGMNETPPRVAHCLTLIEPLRASRKIRGARVVLGRTFIVMPVTA